MSRPQSPDETGSLSGSIAHIPRGRPISQSLPIENLCDHTRRIEERESSVESPNLLCVHSSRDRDILWADAIILERERSRSPDNHSDVEESEYSSKGGRRTESYISASGRREAIESREEQLIYSGVQTVIKVHREQTETPESEDQAEDVLDQEGSGKLFRRETGKTDPDRTQVSADHSLHY